MIEQNQQNNKRKQSKIKCEYCGDRIKLEDRLQVQIKEFNWRSYNSTLLNPRILASKNYHKKCYIERYKDYQNMKRRYENEN